MNPNVNCGFGVIKMCSYRLVNCNKCTTLVEDVDNKGGYEYVESGEGSMREMFVPSS